MSSRQERIGAVLARIPQHCFDYSFSSFASTAPIRRLKFRLKQSDGASPLPPIAAASPSVHVGRSVAASAHATAAQKVAAGTVFIFVFSSDVRVYGHMPRCFFL